MELGLHMRAFRHPHVLKYSAIPVVTKTMNAVNITTVCVNLTLQVDEDYFPTAIRIFQTILFSIVCLVGIVGNTLVIYVVVRFSRLQTVTNMYLANLAIADEFFLIGIPFLITTIWFRQWIFGYYACKAYMISTSINQFTSSVFLCIMSADRYLAVCHPTSSSTWRTPSISRIVSGLAWSFSLILIIPIMRYAAEIEINGKKSCVIHWGSFNPSDNSNDFEMDDGGAKMFTYYTFICSFFIPLSLIIVFYTLVLRRLRTVGPKNKSKEKKRTHRKVSNIVTAVVTVYGICWLPYWVTQFAIDGSNDNFYITLHLLASCMSYFNSAVNPILYAFLSDNFKKSFMKACMCGTRKDVNAILQLENSVFPNKKKAADRSKQLRGANLRLNDIEMSVGPLVNGEDASTSAISQTSRTTHTLWHNRCNVPKVLNNGAPSSTTENTTMA